MYHILIGLVWAWFLRELWHEFNPRWISLSVFASLLPDIDHFLFFFGYGRSESYTQQIKLYFRNRQWRLLLRFVETGHKQNTNLRYHNFYTMGLLMLVTLTSFLFEWQMGVILFGAMFLHYAFDVWDDILTLGYVNSNWKRWGREKPYVSTGLKPH